MATRMPLSTHTNWAYAVETLRLVCLLSRRGDELHDDNSRDLESTLQREIHEEAIQRTMEMCDDLRSVTGTLRVLFETVTVSLRQNIEAVNIVIQNVRNIPDIDFSVNAMQAIREGIDMVQNADENDISDSERREGLNALEETMEVHMRVTRLMEHTSHVGQIQGEMTDNLQRTRHTLEQCTDISLAALTDQEMMAIQSAAQEELRAMKSHVGEMGRSMREIRLGVNELCNDDASSVQAMWTKNTDSEGYRPPDMIGGSESSNQPSGRNNMRSDTGTHTLMGKKTLSRPESPESLEQPPHSQEPGDENGWRRQWKQRTPDSQTQRGEIVESSQTQYSGSPGETLPGAASSDKSPTPLLSRTINQSEDVPESQPASPILLPWKSVVRNEDKNQSPIGSNVVHVTRGSSFVNRTPDTVVQRAIPQTARELTEQYLLMQTRSPGLDSSTRSQPATPLAFSPTSETAFSTSDRNTGSDPNMCTMKLVRVPLRVPDHLLTQNSPGHANVCDRSVMCLSGPHDIHHPHLKDANDN